MNRHKVQLALAGLQWNAGSAGKSKIINAEVSAAIKRVTDKRIFWKMTPIKRLRHPNEKYILSLQDKYTS